MGATPEPLSIAVADGSTVSALWQRPADARACYVMAHGAGAGMTHPSMTAFAAELGRRGIATLRYQFPYMERGSKRPDAPKVAHATVRAAVVEAGRLAPDLALYAGGRSFGGRMTSQAQALSPLPGVRGLAFLGFPLHPAGQALRRARRPPVRRTGSDALPAGNAR
jgi:predicted alpha/beta-hydrolase family hydrolase